MNDKLLQNMRKEVNSKMDANQKQIDAQKRVNELRKDPAVIEYIKALRIIEDNKGTKKLTEKGAILSIYRKYLYLIKPQETNQLFVYMGTYFKGGNNDIIHGENDTRVNYDNQRADYRLYWDIEQTAPETVPIELCEQFEIEHQVLGLGTENTERDFYEMQAEFFCEAAKNQAEAKKKFLKKYGEKKRKLEK